MLSRNSLRVMAAAAHRGRAADAAKFSTSVRARTCLSAAVACCLPDARFSYPLSHSTRGHSTVSSFAEPDPSHFFPKQFEGFSNDEPIYKTLLDLLLTAHTKEVRGCTISDNKRRIKNILNQLDTTGQGSSFDETELDAALAREVAASWLSMSPRFKPSPGTY